MKKPRNVLIIISLIVIGAIIGISACAANVSAQQKGNFDAQVNTAVEATLVQRMVETRVAAESIALAPEPALQATSTPLPTPTLVPTEAAQPTVAAPVQVAQPTVAAPAAPAAGPKITADQNTNCRVGPGTRYRIETFFMKGAVSTVEGRDAGKDWWYIVNPDDASGFCWVWDGSTTVEGDTSKLPVVGAPAGDNLNTGNWYYNNWYYGSYYYPYSCGKNKWNKGVICIKNPPPCYPNNWWNCNLYNNCNCNPYNNCNCNPYNNCGCNSSWQNPCKKSNCPPVTQVNFDTYCDKYPKCCD